MENIDNEKNNLKNEIKLSSLQPVDESLKFIKSNIKGIYDIEMNKNTIPKK